MIDLPCPRCGYKLRKKRDDKGRTAKVCPYNCMDIDGCRFNHNIKHCYWCNACSKHYSLVKTEKVIFT